MRIHRGLFYAGLFLAALGGVLVVADLAGIDSARLTDVIRLWPLAIIAIGAAIVLRRRPRVSLASGMLAAALPGLVLGSGFAAAPRIAGDCGSRAATAAVVTQDGTFAGPAEVSIRTACGSLAVATLPGNAWRFDASNTAGRTANVVATPNSLAIDSDRLSFDGPFARGDQGRDTWQLSLPTSELRSLDVRVDLGSGTLDLAGAQIGALSVRASAADVRVDATGASIANLNGTADLGRLTILLSANADLTGTFRVGASQLRICTAPGLGLLVTSHSGAGQVTVNGLRQEDTSWQSPDYLTAPHHANLDVRVDLGAVEINPIGGCK